MTTLCLPRQMKSVRRNVRRRVLLIENHPGTASAMSRLLRVQGFTVDWAATRNEAIHALEATRYAFMISGLEIKNRIGGIAIRVTKPLDIPQFIASIERLSV